MALDPSISLNVAGGGGANAPALAGAPTGIAANPLSLVTGLAGLQRTQAETQNLDVNNQNLRNQVQQFNASFAARQKAGALIAAAPSLDAGLAAIQADPDVMAFAPTAPTEIKNLINAGLTTNLLNTQIGQGQSEITKTQAATRENVYNFVVRSLAGSANKPENAPNVVNAALNMVPASLRADTAKSVQSIVSSLTDRLPGEPGSPEQIAEYNKRMIAATTSVGLPPDQVYLGAGAVPPTLVSGQSPTGAPITGLPAGGFSAPASPSAASPPALTGMPPAAHSQAEATGPAIVAQEQEINKAAAAIPTMAIRLNNLTQALSEAQAGGGADFRGHVASLMQGIANAEADAGAKSSFSPEQIDKVANGSLSATQFFNAQVRGLAIKQMAVDAAGTGKFMLPEVEAALQSASIQNDPKMLDHWLTQARQALQISYQKIQGYDPFVARVNNGDPELAGRNALSYERWFQPDLNNLPKTTKGGIPLAKPDDLQIKGTASATPTATHKYVPGQGIVPISP